MGVGVSLTEPDISEKEMCVKGVYMSAKQTVRHPCKCSRVDPEHTIEDGGDGWTRYVCSSCGKVKFVWSGDAVKDSEGK
jgi:hypothetical protein